MRYILSILMLISPLCIYAEINSSPSETQDRIKPIGQVHLEENNSNTPQKEKPITQTLGQKIYEQHCIVCHRDGVAGAPKFQDAMDWKARLAQGDINTLLASAIKGKNAMPPKGTCQECSDSDIKAAIQYMIPQK